MSEHDGERAQIQLGLGGPLPQCLRNSEIDGTANRMRALPPFSAAVRSAIFKAVKVFPVPHAMISLPRSCP